MAARLRVTLLIVAVLAAITPGRADETFPRAVLTLMGTFEEPVALAPRPGDARLFVAEKTGRVRTLSGAVVLDLAAEVSTGDEQGLLGLTFSPDGSRLYVNITDKVGTGRTHIVSFAMAGQNVDLTSRREVLVFDRPFDNHFGGALAFGRDGYLYISVGDGNWGDPLGNGQRLDTLLGKILRIDPRPSGAIQYVVPATNPFVGRPGARPEIWAYGLRNPWRLSFDRMTGDLWVGDVGQTQWEEINHQPFSSKGGENYGWALMEGNHPYVDPSAPGRSGAPPPNHVAPVYEYSHTPVPGGVLPSGCAVVGGYVYRGTRIAGLQGRFVWGDFCVGRMWYLREVAGQNVTLDLATELPTSLLTSFGEDNAGELYAMSFEGGVYRLDPA